MFSPFTKPTNQLSADDLSDLRQVAEGWYVEYKREVPNAASIAKSVAALANTSGGWVFFGVEELSKTEPVAGSFPGVSLAAVEAAQQQIRSACANLMPVPHFTVITLRGPSADEALADDRAVIGVQVPMSLVAPHVHKDGRIYRRVGDSSEPRAENDRHLLDQLMKRGDGVRKEFKLWLGRDPELSKAESNMPLLRVLLCPDLWDDRGYSLDLKQRDVFDLFNENEGKTFFRGRHTVKYILAQAATSFDK